jgi:cell wall-associated NlpC family hydrolase
MRRLFAAITLFLGCLALPVAAQGERPSEPAAAAGSAVGSWAEPQIRSVVARGLMGGSLATFRPDDVLTLGELSELIADLSRPEAGSTSSSVNSSKPVTMAGLDARLVRALGLNASANRFVAAARAAGLTPPSRFGTEVVARLLGLRTNHQVPHDDLELLPADPATRAEAAFSAARLLALGSADLQAVKTAARSLELPEVDEWQRRVLDVAVGLIGFPYVWGGLSERVQTPFGVRAPGGFDCSGFVWRVYKLEPYDEGEALSATLKGRTTYAMSGEVSKARRVPFARLRPADVIFFGERGPKSKPDEVDHMGVYLGDGWFIHSSESGVALARIADWYRTRFAWARRPLAEAGLSPPSGG